MATPCVTAPPSDHHVGAVLADLLQEFGDERRPPGLVASADARAVVAVEVFVKREQVAPVWITLELLRAAKHRAPPVAVAQEDARQALRDLDSNLPQAEHPT